MTLPRRDPIEPDRATTETVTGYLCSDHDRLEAILAGVCASVSAGKLVEAGAQLAEYAGGLRRHIRIEEDLVFPLFEARTGVTSGPTVLLRSEHDEIRRALELMIEAVEAGRAEDFREALRFLKATLPEHNDLEEHILYPTTDRLLSEREQRALVDRLRRE